MKAPQNGWAVSWACVHDTHILEYKSEQFNMHIWQMFEEFSLVSREKGKKHTFERFKVVKLRSLYFGSVWYLHEMKMKILENNNPCLPCLPVSSGKAAPIAPSQATCIRWLPQTESRLNILTHATSKQTSKTEQVPIMFL